ncbi:hypothetical protein BC936DRAFT_142871 [Jimgerdemannia flammicorona]|uniref:Uncharacterized protein n=1 Tax=Jimgerdemannia flammicorona TaxID=994334 RepID=A0A433DEM5_9FUNG|nr:hypothetical protein BC936DRAFT_142871 [Jimgerdemannia flammicorona]
MQFPPECRDALQVPDFWEATDEPSLRKFLDFRLSAADLKDEATEHHKYITDLNKLSKFYAEVSETGKKIRKWRNTLKASELLLLLNNVEQSWKPEYTDYPAGFVLAVGTGSSLLVRTYSADYLGGFVLLMGTGSSLSVVAL